MENFVFFFPPTSTGSGPGGRGGERRIGGPRAAGATSAPAGRGRVRLPAVPASTSKIRTSEARAKTVGKLHVAGGSGKEAFSGGGRGVSRGAEGRVDARDCASGHGPVPCAATRRSWLLCIVTMCGLCRDGGADARGYAEDNAEASVGQLDVPANRTAGGLSALMTGLYTTASSSLRSIN
jgi:hypothetical protein